MGDTRAGGPAPPSPARPPRCRAMAYKDTRLLRVEGAVLSVGLAAGALVALRFALVTGLDMKADTWGFSFGAFASVLTLSNVSISYARALRESDPERAQVLAGAEMCLFGSLAFAFL